MDVSLTYCMIELMLCDVFYLKFYVMLQFNHSHYLKYHAAAYIIFVADLIDLYCLLC